MAHLVVAAKDLEIGRVLKEDDVKVSDWPGGVPLGAVVKMQDLVGRGVIAPIYDKEPVLETRLAPRGAGGGLASMIPNGMRAVANRVNEIAGVAGFVTPGTRVDVFLFANAQRNRLKLPFWDGSGLWVCAKRLEKGRFRWPETTGEETLAVLSREELALLRGGIGPADVQRRLWYRREATPV
jgi:hypothetical protein